MEASGIQRVAERFAALPAGKRRAVYERMQEQGVTFADLPILPRPPEATGVLSYAQQRQWFLWQLAPASTAYHIAGALTLTGPLDVEAVRASFAALAARHESLRTVFRPSADGLAEPVVQPAARLDVPVIDVSERAGESLETRVAEVARQASATPFDLTQGPLLRVVVIRVTATEHVLVVAMHHIVSDAWSLRILVEEFAAMYRARVLGSTPPLPALPIEYADYAVWQRNWLEAGEKERQLAYWKAQLGDEHPVLQLPTDRPRRANGSYRAARTRVELPRELVQGLRRQASHHGATLFMALLAGFQVLLHRYTGQADIRVGVPLANRHRAEIAGVVGLFVNTQVLRNLIYGRTPLQTVLDQVRHASLGAQAHQDLPFEQLVDALQAQRSLHHSPLFQVMFNHLHGDGRASAQLPGLTLREYPLADHAAQFELTLEIIEQPTGEVSATLIYAAELFEPDTIARLGAHYLRVLDALARDPALAVGDVPLLSDDEQRRLADWSRAVGHYPLAEPVHRMIERRADALPQAPALIFGDTELSYAELNRRANRLAHRLIALGVRPETKVGIAAERSVEMVVGMLAIMKAGGAYVPLDPDYPA